MIAQATDFEDVEKRRISIKQLLPGIVILFLVAIGLFSLWRYVPQFRQTIVPVLIGLGFIGIYPLTYLAYLAFGEDAQRKRLRDDFQLFGLVDDKDLDETINQLYQNVYSWPQFAVYISLIVTITTILLLGFIYREVLTIFPADMMELIFYGYLGAYVFSVQELIRRYNTFDLQPQVYSSILVRILVATILTLVITTVIMLNGNLLQLNGEQIDGNAKAWLATIAFAVGIFPNDGLNWILQQANRILNPVANRNSELPLRNLLGINAWHESRLSMMGIDDAQNLATADIPKLLLTTQFDTQQVANWIDQAILYVKVNDRIERYREAKITTFHELQCAIEGLTMHVDFKIDVNGHERSNLATLLGLTSPDELTRLREYSNFPNYTHIANFYEGSGRVGSQRAEESVQKLIGATGIDVGTGWDSLSGGLQEQKGEISELLKLKRQLHGRSRDPSLYTRLGIIKYKLHDLDRAKIHFDNAIQLDTKFTQAYFGRSAVYMENEQWELALQDISKVIELTPTDAEAFNQRGLIYFRMGHHERAIKDLNRALELDNRLVVAYYNRGVAFYKWGFLGKVTEDFEKAHLLGYRQAGLWLFWGLALLSDGRYRQAIEKLSLASTQDPDLAEAYANRGKAYLALGEAYFDQARIDLQTALRKDDSLWATHNDLGNLEFQQRNLENAIVHYRKAIQTRLDKDGENYFLARHNLAVAYHQLLDMERAVEQFQLLNQLTAGRDLTSEEQDKWDSLINMLRVSSATLNRLQIALDLHKQLHDVEGQAWASKHLGRFYQRKGELTKALCYLQESVRLFEAVENEAETAVLRRQIQKVQASAARVYRQAGNFYKCKEEWTRTIYYFEQAVQLYDAIDQRAEVDAINLEIQQAQEQLL